MNIAMIDNRLNREVREKYEVCYFCKGKGTHPNLCEDCLLDDSKCLKCTRKEPCPECDGLGGWETLK